MFTRMWVRATQVIDDERGDVPGWVLITLMTATLVMIIWAFAGPALLQMVEDGLKGVTFKN